MRKCLQLILLVSLLLVTVQSTAYAQESLPRYLVQEGDSLYSIAVRFGTSIDEIIQVNEMMDLSVLIPGMELFIPGFSGFSGYLRTHTFQYGDTLQGLAVAYRSSVNAIVELNRLLNPARLYVGQQLVVPAETDDTVEMDLELMGVMQSTDTLLGLSAAQQLNPWVAKKALSSPGMYVIAGQLLQQSDAIPLEGPAFIQLELHPEYVVQGHTLELEVSLREGYTPSAKLNGEELAFNRSMDGRFIALQGIDALAETGLETIALQVLDESDTPVYSFAQSIEVMAGSYGYDPVLYVPPETIDPITTAAEAEAVNAVVSVVTPQKMWSGIFEWPTFFYESFPAVFGSRRNYNEQGYHSYHTGLDLYGNLQTEILAPADGVVVMVQELPARGLATYIDHGWGVFSGYGHQSEVFVQVGDQVTEGQRIGMVGASGRVTGPHLHWEIVVGGHAVNPIEWTERIFPYSSGVE